MLDLPQVTLLGIDCVDIDRLLHAAAISQRGIRFGAVRLLSSLPHPDPCIVPIAPISTIEAYSQFVIKQLNRYVATPHVLLIQYDGFVLNPDAWSAAFLTCDYIGAPWLEEDGYIVGNGGFSLRSKRLLELLAHDDAIALPPGIDDIPTPEDWYLSVMIRDYLEQHGMRWAPVEVAKAFAIEGGPDGVTWNGQFGFHGLSWTDISPWLREHPDAAIDNTLDAETLALKAQFGS